MEVALTPKAWRKARDLSIVAVAKSLSVNPATWKKWEEEPSLIPFGKAEEFCKLIGVEFNMVIFLP